jgi:diguanylate cyclase (GGDEF)-like protein
MPETHSAQAATRASESSPLDRSRSRRRFRRWGIVAAGLLAIGVGGSVAAAGVISERNAERSRVEFDRSSSDVVSTLQLAIQRQEDLVVNASGLVASDPTISEAEFGEWAALTNVFDRYPEVGGFGVAVIVPLGEFDAFVEQARVERGAQFPADGSFELLPPGDRAFYCLTKLQLNRTGQMTPIGTDWCAASGLSLTARDSGVSTYTPITVGTDEFLSVNVPIYRADLPLESVEDHRQAFIGWVGTMSTPQLILEQAARAHPGLIVSMSFVEASSTVEFASGPVPAGFDMATTDLGNGWTINTFGDVAAETVLGDRESRTALIALVLLSVAVAALVFVLGTGRARAVRLVAERTGELHHRALHDELTGLPNRALIIDRLDQLLARNRRRGSDPSALFIDIDDFKNVNDTLGHQAGDQLLRDVTARLTSTLRTADTLGRMGGDEFVVLIDGDRAVDGFSTPRSPELVAERLLAVMREPFELDGASAPLVVNTSIGIATGDRNSGDELLRDADVALYEAKAAGKNRFEVFDPEMERDMARRVELEFGLREAMDSHHFWLAYQPIYHLDDLSLVGVEALVRWSHPTLGTIGPDEFLPVLEQTGQIHEFGRWVLHEACRQMAEWHERGDTLDLSVNVSGRQLEHDVIVDHVRSALCDSGLAATSLTIEVSETDLMRNTNAVAVRLHAIHELGVRIAVDDFGTGYFSLAYLQHFPVDCLKIDRAFTNAITTSSESKTLIRTLVQLGTDLGLTTLAEGVETSDQMDHLRIANVNDAQGFLFSRPLAARAFEMQLLFPMRRQNSASKPDPRI